MSTEIPADRPVLGADVTKLERKIGLKSGDIQYILGCTPHSFFALKRGDTNPVMSQALLIRLLMLKPELYPVPTQSTIQRLYELCCEIDSDFTPRHLGVLLGRDGTAGYKWLNRAGGQSLRQGVGRLAMMLCTLLEETTPNKRKVKLTEIYDLVILEAAQRGMDTEVLRERFRFVKKGSEAAKARKKRPGARKTAPIRTSIQK